MTLFLGLVGAESQDRQKNKVQDQAIWENLDWPWFCCELTRESQGTGTSRMPGSSCAVWWQSLRWSPPSLLSLHVLAIFWRQNVDLHLSHPCLWLLWPIDCDTNIILGLLTPGLRRLLLSSSWNVSSWDLHSGKYCVKPKSHGEVTWKRRKMLC